ncbi:N-acetylmuramoyl-L-alanine amidase [Phyllobacterium sp. YR620]|uniref:N-acetylmuramoyl-L-alanine amidase n=1 Tax=Phyllobacterium TaxID=28100 RepID=UPI00089094FA|nr:MULTISPECIES: N-acetylmuramoyl-L-alanine amidase [unclassified Phyllobacterium]UGY08774.1 N-acetylmuramoyl-L-alanine amidase [Phyllobacterium sp. T1018]SDP09169.1 N-acetylmuramoyl-L-alanine amidase [Phyllobacterium sp. YR620]SFI92932.1 N-acetylmuramoyl-L-alanine amidase [Phyllobacterium sp. CL33Tsu]
MAAFLGLVVSLQGGAVAHAAGDLAALTYQAAGDELRTRVVINFDQEPDISTMLLGDPHRLAIDMPKTVFGFDKKSTEARGLITDVRYGMIDATRSRLIFTLKGPFAVERIDVLKNDNSPGYRLVADLVASSDRAFAEALKTQNQTTASTTSTPTGDRLAAAAPGEASQAPKPFTVVVDAGHGGIDSGAESAGGSLEKNVTLMFAQQLRDELQKISGIRVEMTRNDDTFLRLSERVRIARQYEADLFVSIHADTINRGNIRGATVYTVSDRASDADSRAMADRENRADAVAGIAFDNEAPEIADILMDLTRRETHNFSLSFAKTVVKSLKKDVNMINNPHRFAGFQVLRAPDVPSVLVEIGYLSNQEDEKLMLDPAWRSHVAERLATAVGEFAGMKTAGALN